tara:strand:- start:340 stop:1014 length:675 start_codon:yes stop_codon:yes gene_type:complete
MIEDCKRVAPILLIWLGVSTVVYLHLYWSRFGIDPFGYISFYEVLNYTGQFFLVAAGSAVAIGILELLFPSIESRKYLESDTDIIRLAVGLALLVGIASFFLKENFPSIVFLYFTIAPVLATWVSRTDIAKEYVTNGPIRIACLIFIFAAPYSALSLSQERASEILNDKASKKVFVKMTGSALEKELVLVGRLGEFTFLKEIGASKVVGYSSAQIEHIGYTSES